MVGQKSSPSTTLFNVNRTWAGVESNTDFRAQGLVLSHYFSSSLVREVKQQIQFNLSRHVFDSNENG
jgi:hypothetical protein